MRTRYSELIKNVNHSKILSVTMHGQYVDEHSNVFYVPNNTYVVFVSKPGYRLSSTFLSHPFYRLIMSDTDTMRRFLLDELPGPAQFSHWKDHIYAPGDKIRDIKFVAGEPGLRVKWLHTSVQSIQPTTLERILLKRISSVPGKKIIFVVSCRSHKNTYNFFERRKLARRNMVRRRIEMGESPVSPITKKQNYKVPLSGFLKRLLATERRNRPYEINREKRVKKLVNSTLKSQKIKRQRLLSTRRWESVARARRAS